MAFIFREASSSIYSKLKLTRKKWCDYQDFRGNQCCKFFNNASFNQKYNLFKYFRGKIHYVLHWYEEVSGLKDVRIAQDKVTKAGDKFAELQEIRRQASASLREIHHELKQIYSKLDNTERGGDQYVKLILQESKLLKEGNIRETKFAEAEMAEREQFTVLSNAVRDSHAKERLHSNKVKYWSVISSVLGAMLGITGTLVNYYVKFSEFTKLHATVNEGIKEQLQEIIETTRMISNNFLYLAISGKHSSGIIQELHTFQIDKLPVLHKTLMDTKGDTETIKENTLAVLFFVIVLIFFFCLCCSR